MRWLRSRLRQVASYDNCPPAASHTCTECERVAPSVCDRMYAGRHYFAIDGTCQRCGIDGGVA